MQWTRTLKPCLVCFFVFIMLIWAGRGEMLEPDLQVRVFLCVSWRELHIKNARPRPTGVFVCLCVYLDVNRASEMPDPDLQVCFCVYLDMH